LCFGHIGHTDHTRNDLSRSIQPPVYLHSLADLIFLPLVTALAVNGSMFAIPDGIFAVYWAIPVTTSSIVLTMPVIVNTLVTLQV
jgi:hypothetical protein